MQLLPCQIEPPEILAQPVRVVGGGTLGHPHDVRGTFVTYLMTATDPTDVEIASIMGWSPAEVERIRRSYVDDTVRQIVLGKRLARGFVGD